MTSEALPFFPEQQGAPGRAGQAWPQGDGMPFTEGWEGRSLRCDGRTSGQNSSPDTEQSGPEG